MVSFFAVLAKNPSSGVHFHCLEPHTTRIPPPPRFWFGDFKADTSSQYFTRSRNLHPVGVYRAQNIRVSVDTLWSKDGEFLLCPSALFPSFEVTERAVRDPSTVKQISSAVHPLFGEYALIFFPGFQVYGHWLIDYLSKIFLLTISGYDIHSLRLLVPNNLPKFGYELLRLIGMSDSQFVKYNFRSTLLVEKLLIPTRFRNFDRCSNLFTKYCHWLKARIEATTGPLFTADQTKRLFIARRSNNRMLVNRAGIETIARQRHYRLVLPERLPLVEQMKLFASARSIVGEYGSALHASLFSKAGTIVCALRAHYSSPGLLQSGIGEALGQPTGYVFGSLIDEQEKSFFIPEELMKSCLSVVALLEEEEGM